MSNQCCAKEKYKQQQHVFCWKTWATNKPFDRNSFFSVSVWTKHGKKCPIENPQKSPSRNAPKPPRTPLAPSMDRSVLVADIALSSGNLCTSRWAFRADFFINGVLLLVAPTKWPKIAVGFFTPIKWSYIRHTHFPKASLSMQIFGFVIDFQKRSWCSFRDGICSKFRPFHSTVPRNH